MLQLAAFPFDFELDRRAGALGRNAQRGWIGVLAHHQRRDRSAGDHSAAPRCVQSALDLLIAPAGIPSDRQQRAQRLRAKPHASRPQMSMYSQLDAVRLRRRGPEAFRSLMETLVYRPVR